MPLETKHGLNPFDYLYSLLSPQNQKRLQSDRCIYVRGSNGGKYVIMYGFAGIVREMPPDWEPGLPFRPVSSWCAYPQGIGQHTHLRTAAYAISMVTQMLSIQANEEHFRQVALASGVLAWVEVFR